MIALPVGITLWTRHRASVLLPLSSVSVELMVLEVSCTAGVSDDTSPPSSLGDTSASACAIHGSAALIVGPSCRTPGRIWRANACVGPKEASSAENAPLLAWSRGGSKAMVWLRSCCRDARVEVVASNVLTRLASWSWREPSALNTCSLPTTTPERSCGRDPSSAWLTIAEDLKASAEYLSDRLSACAPVSPRTLGSWDASCAAVGRPLSADPRPTSSVCRFPRAAALSVERTRSSWTGPVVFAAGRVAADGSVGAPGVPGCRST